jgi:hypothetical protein
MESVEKKRKEIDSDTNNNGDIITIFKKMNIDTPEKRNIFHYYYNEKPKLNYTIGYSSTTKGPFKNA